MQVNKYTVGTLVLLVLASTVAAAGHEGRAETTAGGAEWAAATEELVAAGAAGAPCATLVLGYTSLEASDWATAFQAFSRAGKFRPRDLDGALAEVEAFSARRPDSWVGQLLRTDLLARAARYDEALRAASHAVESSDGRPLTYHVRGLVHALSGRDEAAAVDFGRAISRDAGFADAYAARGTLRLRGNAREQAVVDLDTAVDLAWDSAVAVNARGVAFCRSGRHQEGFRCFQFAQGLEPTFAAAARNAEAAERLVNREKARTRIASLAGGGTLGLRDIRVVVSDFGINHWSPKLKMFDNFGHAAAGPVVRDLPAAQQVIIPMPSDAHFPKTPADKALLTEKIAEGIIRRIDASGDRALEVRLVQNVNTSGYFAPWRQAKVKEFGKVAYDALSEVRRHYEALDTKVNMPAVVGSNGAFLLTETLPSVKSNPIDKAVLIDGRATLDSVKNTYQALKGKLAVINTAGDCPALGNMIANHEAAKSLRQELPEMSLLWTDAKGPDLFVTQHVSAMKPQTELLVKEHIGGNKYTVPVRTDAGDLLSSLLDMKLTAPSARIAPKGACGTTVGGRGGVVIAGDDTVEVVDARGAKMDLPWAASRGPVTDLEEALACPFLIFPGTGEKE